MMLAVKLYDYNDQAIFWLTDFEGCEYNIQQYILAQCLRNGSNNFDDA